MGRSGPAAACMSAGLLAAALAGCGSTTANRAAGGPKTTTRGEATRAIPIQAAAIPGPACGTATGKTLAASAGLVATRIYKRELASTGVRADQSQVERNTPLLSALASGNRPAVKEAVTRLVFSGTHIVRLRVSQGGAVLADVGGPYILAPVGSSLRFQGRTVGSYLLSVQDDLGYVKLESRFIGLPLIVLQGSRRIPLEGTLPGPASIPEQGPVSYGGKSYEAFSFKATAFPSGPLRISLLIPVPASLSATSCAQIKVSELGGIARRLWRRFALAQAPPLVFIHSVQSLIGGLGFVRSGSHQLAGSIQPGPLRLPDGGTVKYRGVTYGVSSFAARSAGTPVRVSLLVTP
jgi:hypothetical protein